MKNKRKMSPIVGLVVSLVVLVVSGAIGGVTGVFNGFGGFMNMIKLDFGVIIQLIVMVAFLSVVSNVLLLVFKALQLKLCRN